MHGMLENDLEPLDYASLNPGIREVVSLLRQHGYDTTDSGDGITNIAAGMEGAIPAPHVHCVIDPASFMHAANKIVALLLLNGVEVQPGMVQVVYDPMDGVCTVSVYGINDEMLLEAQRKKSVP